MKSISIQKCCCLEKTSKRLCFIEVIRNVEGSFSRSRPVFLVMKHNSYTTETHQDDEDGDHDGHEGGGADESDEKIVRRISGSQRSLEEQMWHSQPYLMDLLMRQSPTLRSSQGSAAQVTMTPTPLSEQHHDPQNGSTACFHCDRGVERISHNYSSFNFRHLLSMVEDKVIQIGIRSTLQVNHCTVASTNFT